MATDSETKKILFEGSLVWYRNALFVDGGDTFPRVVGQAGLISVDSDRIMLQKARITIEIPAQTQYEFPRDSHGRVYPLPNGAQARCFGPPECPVCRAEQQWIKEFFESKKR